MDSSSKEMLHIPQFLEIMEGCSDIFVEIWYVGCYGPVDLSWNDPLQPDQHFSSPVYRVFSYDICE